MNNQAVEATKAGAAAAVGAATGYGAIALTGVTAAGMTGAGAGFGMAAYGGYRIFRNPPTKSMTRNESLVHASLAYAEQLYGRPPAAAATFDVQEVPNARHADWDGVNNHVTIRIPPNMNDIDREGQLAHESFHVFSPATLAEATYFDEGFATYLAVQHLIIGRVQVIPSIAKL